MALGVFFDVGSRFLTGTLLGPLWDHFWTTFGPLLTYFWTTFGSKLGVFFVLDPIGSTHYFLRTDVRSCSLPVVLTYSARRIARSD